MQREKCGAQYQNALKDLMCRDIFLGFQRNMIGLIRINYFLNKTFLIIICVLRFFILINFYIYRWLQWVQACGRLDLQPKGPIYAYSNCYLCHLHFEEKWYNINKVRARLHPDAVPTRFFEPAFNIRYVFT